LLDVIHNITEAKKYITRENLLSNKDYSIWRYADILPVNNRVGENLNVPPLHIGWTPVYKLFDIRHSKLYIKDDGRNPTASFKDRASAVGVTKAMELGEKVMTCASTGNAASSLSGVCASVGMKSYIFVPKSAPKAKIVQLLIYGANVIMVNGTYDQAFDLCLQATKEFGWYNRNTGYNPYLLEGKKTAGLEICEQFNFNPPDRIYVSVGDGCIIGGLWKGFTDFYKLGIIDKLPKIIGVQSTGCSPLVKAFNSTFDIRHSIFDIRYFIELSPHTIADSISVGHPRVPIQALRAVVESKGKMMAVSDDEILSAMRNLARTSGVFAEPAGITGFAGLMQDIQNNLIESNETVLALITGNGLKDIATAEKSASELTQPLIIEPTIDAVKSLFSKI
jgi:threonine synthase